MKFRRKSGDRNNLDAEMKLILRLVKKNNEKNHQISKQLAEVKSLVKQQNLRALRENFPSKIERPQLDVSALSYFSQHNEDGVILTILDTIGLNAGISYELGAGDNGGCTGTLSLMRGFKSVFIDQDFELVKELEKNFAFGENRIYCEKILPDNVNNLVHENPDVLSCDLDSIDYWILSALEARPKIVIAEYNATLGPDYCVTVPANYLDLEITSEMKIAQFYGCSLSSLTKLFEARNMSLVYCDTSGTNAFFIDNEYKHDFTKLTPTQAYRASKKSNLAHSRGYTPDIIVSQFQWESV
jgi:hypothetical protein